MDVLPKFVDMALTPKEMKEEDSYETAPKDLYPYGLCICLDQDSLDKLSLDTNVDAGDHIRLQAIGKVTSVTKRDTDEGPQNRIEIQLTAIAVADSGEAEETTAKPKMKNFYKK